MRKKSLETGKPILGLILKVNYLAERLKQAGLRILELEAENAELQRRLNSNSCNSSRPPSSDGYKDAGFPKE